MSMSRTLLLLMALLVGTHGRAQVKKAEVKDLAFMQGRWFVAHEWGDMEEYWGEPMGNNMVSSYRCVKNGKVVFYEFVVIEQGENVPVLLLRHFNPGNIAWEDKTTPQRYPLVELTANKATFKDDANDVLLRYELTAPDALTVTLVEKNKQGVPETIYFRYKRKS